MKSAIELTANRQDTEPNRIERLRELSVLIEAHPKLKGKVAGLHDHKGWLAVNWKTPPTARETSAVDAIWKDAFGETYADHFFCGGFCRNSLSQERSVFGAAPFQSTII